MSIYISLAWRNLWRNKRRTLLAALSVFFAVLLATIFRSTQSGQHSYFIQMSASMYTGYLQVQRKGYWDERSFDYSFEEPDSLKNMLPRNPNITTINPRIESVALVSHGNETRITPVTGIVPKSENEMSGLKKRLVKGAYLTDSSRGILIAGGLAERLQVGIGDSVVLFSQGYQGATAAEELPIEGILYFPIPKINNAAVFLSLAKAQEFFNAYNRITGIALMLSDPDKITETQSSIASQVNSNLVVMSWEEMSPEIVQAIEADVASEIIIMFILYLVIGFGVFGTVMMMTIERTREFGLLISLGMKRTKLLLVSTIETLLVSVIGAAAGTAASIPLIYYFYFHPIHLSGDAAKAMLAYGYEPIIPVSVETFVFTSQSIAVFAIALAASLYPLFFIRKVQPVSALQGRGGLK
ncbi:MAG TPA: FtsX-like permease family protein [Ignavibacteriaceae bacterium]|nr:FtsX-like permease family protein [Ignavibacteriaceae bacterium]